MVCVLLKIDRHIVLVLHNTYYDYHYLIIHIGLHAQILWNSWKILHWHGRDLSTMVTIVLVVEGGGGPRDNIFALDDAGRSALQTAK